MKKNCDYISASQIGTFMACPLAYKYIYVDGAQRMPPNVYMSYGTAMHAALAFNYEQKIKSRKDLHVHEVETKFLLVFNQECQENNYSEDLSKFYLPAENTLYYYMKEVAPKIQPTHVEYKFEIKLKHFPITIMGYIDLITEDGDIRDHKTAGKSWKSQYTPSKLRNNIQATMYAAAYRKLFKKPEKGIFFDVLPRHESMMYPKETQRTEAQIMSLLNSAASIESIVKLGVFVPNHNSCSTCPFKDGCNREIYVDQPNT